MNSHASTTGAHDQLVQLSTNIQWACRRGNLRCLFVSLGASGINLLPATVGVCSRLNRRAVGHCCARD
jgi:hypothetical protein